jgi:hypothetical protein
VPRHTKEKHDTVAAFLAARRYELATCTIENSDYLFSRAYVNLQASGEAAGLEPLCKEYLEYTAFEIDYFAELGQRVFGYEPPEVMLLHANPLNAELIEQVLAMFECRGYRFVTPAGAQSDAAYRTPDTYITKFGPMWLPVGAGARGAGGWTNGEGPAGVGDAIRNEGQGTAASSHGSWCTIVHGDG